MEESYKKCGWKILIHTEMGVDSKNSAANFSRINDNPVAWAGRLLGENESFEDTVEV